MQREALFSGMRQIKDAGFVDWANAGVRLLGGAVTRGLSRAAIGTGAATAGQVRGAIGGAQHAVGGLSNLHKAVGYGTLGAGALGAGAMGAGYLGGRMAR